MLAPQDFLPGILCGSRAGDSACRGCLLWGSCRPFGLCRLCRPAKTG